MGRPKDLSGKTFGCLRVLRMARPSEVYSASSRHQHWYLFCDPKLRHRGASGCGRHCIMRSDILQKCVSCGHARGTLMDRKVKHVAKVWRGPSMKAIDVARAGGIKDKTFYTRIARGQSPLDAATVPARAYGTER